MIVARHEMPGTRKKGTRPGGTAEDVRPGEIFRQFRARPESGVPPGRDRFVTYSRHFVPGYYHSDPPGQELSSFFKLTLMGFNPGYAIWSD
jgi:hypothetical protein